MSKEAINRRMKHLSRTGGFLDFIRTVPANDIHVSGGEKSIDTTKRNASLIAMLSSTETIVSVRAKRVVDYVASKIKPNSLVSSVLDELTKGVSIRPPFEAIYFEFQCDGYLHYGAFCQYIEDLNKIFVLGVRTKKSTRGIDIFIDHSAGVVELDDEGLIVDHWSSSHEDGIDNDDVITLAEVVFTLALMNCRNIELVDHETDSIVARQYHQYFGRYPIKFKTLAIKSMTKQYSATDSKEYQGVLPEHLRRGHFKTFTEDNPRFGYNHPSNVGTFWVRATVVGERKNGAIIKDYEVVLS